MAQDIKVRVVFDTSEGVPAALISDILHDVEAALRVSELDALAQIETEFAKEIPRRVMGEVQERFAANSRHTLVIESASEGSIILLGAALGVSYWILDQTLAETLKEAWVKSDLHKRIKAFLNRSTARQADKAAHDLDARLKARRLSTKAAHAQAIQVGIADSKLDIHSEDSALTIVAWVKPMAKLPPKRSIALNGESHQKEADWEKKFPDKKRFLGGEEGHSGMNYA
jgi:hypothetical protein